MKEIFSLKETLRRNIGYILRGLSRIVLFYIGLRSITIYTNPMMNQFTILFLTLIWCYIFLQTLRIRSPVIVYKNVKGDTIEY